ETAIGHNEAVDVPDLEDVQKGVIGSISSVLCLLLERHDGACARHKRSDFDRAGNRLCFTCPSPNAFKLPKARQSQAPSGKVFAPLTLKRKALWRFLEQIGTSTSQALRDQKAAPKHARLHLEKDVVELARLAFQPSDDLAATEEVAEAEFGHRSNALRVRDYERKPDVFRVALAACSCRCSVLVTTQ